MDDLKNKLNSIKQLGCEAFALLWDDIDTSLPSEDRDVFKTLAQAQVKVTNEIFQYLEQPLFLTCPVEYAANRCDPNMVRSEYLNTLGSGLHPDIGMFWTGSKVVSENITKEEIVLLEKTIKRKPIIWDNLHANDYDQQRMFLGPYSGRDPDIIPHLRGIMTNPNCEFSFNIPALFTLATWSHCYDPSSGTVNSWNPVSASELAIPHFLEECRRPTNISIHRQNLKDKLMKDGERESAELTKSDVELLFHLFWLPHSHGPRGELLVNEFKFLRDHAHVILKFDVDEDNDEDNDSDNDDNDNDDHESPEIDFVDSWMERASSFNNVCKSYSKLCDKITFIENRELFFDINSYLFNLNNVLSGCNRYLKWVGLDHCKKPILGGPTLAGLPGGLAGDLHRLFPTKSNFEFPINLFRPVVEKNSYHIQTFNQPEDLEGLKENYFKLFCETLNLEEDDIPRPISEYAESIKLKSFTSQKDVKILGVECDDVIMGVLFATKSVRSYCSSVQAAFDQVKNVTLKYLPIALPPPNSSVPWSSFEKYNAVLSLTCVPELLFTKTLRSLFELMFMILGEDKQPNVAIFVDKNMPITKKFLNSIDFQDVYKCEMFEVLANAEKQEGEVMDEN